MVKIKVASWEAGRGKTVSHQKAVAVFKEAVEEASSPPLKEGAWGTWATFKTNVKRAFLHDLGFFTSTRFDFGGWANVKITNEETEETLGSGEIPSPTILNGGPSYGKGQNVAALAAASEGDTTILGFFLPQIREIEQARTEEAHSLQQEAIRRMKESKEFRKHHKYDYDVAIKRYEGVYKIRALENIAPKYIEEVRAAALCLN